MSTSIYQQILHASDSGQKGIAILLDPDHIHEKNITPLIQKITASKASYVLVGGSLLTTDTLDAVVLQLKKACPLPIILFPGNHQHISPNADAMLLLSLISGRNADFLIGQHVLAAPSLKRSGIELIPTGYILIDGGKPTTVSYISNTTPIPRNKPDIAACTALAGQQLGLKLIYLEAGSGAEKPVSPSMIQATKTHIDIPLLVGGGIKTIDHINEAFNAGADILVIGTAIEKDLSFMDALTTDV